MSAVLIFFILLHFQEVGVTETCNEADDDCNNNYEKIGAISDYLVEHTVWV